MIRYEFFLTSALEKVFPSVRPSVMAEGTVLSAWRGTKAAVQLVYTAHGGRPDMTMQRYQLRVSGAPGPVRFREVGLMSAGLACYEDNDDYYISKEPGLFPDLLTDVDGLNLLPLPRQYRSVWLTFRIPEDADPGEYPVTLHVTPWCHMPHPNGTVFHDPEAEDQTFDLSFTLRVSAAELAPRKLLHTQWFHTDCLSQYYGVEVFSEEYWRITENFIRSAAGHGLNMLLTPVFTPPLDTPVGRERPTVQLVDMSLENGRWSFGFEKLERWVALLRKYGICHVEVPHLFTQWGATSTPKIVATVNGKTEKVFGWDVSAGSKEYRDFLWAFLPALRQKLEELGFDNDHVWYHISDEPSPEHMEAFLTALEQTRGLLDDCHVFDALTNFDFYRKGLVKTPVVSNDYIQPFFDAGVPDLWVYYCCVQGNLVPNRFFAMESARNRIMGVLMYLYDVQGFLHWGFNFYNAKYSLNTIDPFRTADGDCGYPAGDPFLVYPGPDGEPLDSIRGEVQDDAFLDLQALRTLEARAGRQYVIGLIHELAGMEEITFKHYPRQARFLLELRERVAAELDAKLE